MIILFCVISAVFLLLWIRVTVRVRWEQEIEVQIRYLFFRFQAYPRPERTKDKKEKRQAQRERGGGEEKPRSHPRDLRQNVQMAFELLRSAKGALGLLRRNLHIRNLRLLVLVGAGEAAEAAVRCGEIEAYLCGAHAVLSNLVSLHKVQLVVQPDFLSDEGSFSLRFDASLTPLALAGAGLRFCWDFLRNAARSRQEETQIADKQDVKSSGKIEVQP